MIEALEACDDGNAAPGDGCFLCLEELGYDCVPSLFATGVNDAGTALPMGGVDPHWNWSETNDELTAVPAIAVQNVAWNNFPPGRWVSPTLDFGNELDVLDTTYWFQRVEIPAAFAGMLSFPIVVACDNVCEVFVNGVSFGGHNAFTSSATINIPASAFVAGSNLVTVSLVEGEPGTPRGILIYPGGGGILSQCTEVCTLDAQCLDTNPCTTDTCLLGACTNAARPVGSLCLGGACDGDTLAPMCITCVDSSPTGLDAGCTILEQHCRTSGAGAPTCEPCLDSAMGSGTDQGCLAAVPYCVTGPGGNSCTQCLSGADCSDGNSCSQDVCTAGVCSNPSVSAGTVCAGGVCNGTLLVCETCIDNGGGTDTGCTAGTPHCIGLSGARVCVECTGAGQCNDNVACTTDACTLNACVHVPVAIGGAGGCLGGTVCSGSPTNLCVECTNTSAMGTDAGCLAVAPHCRTTGNGAPTCERCLDDANGSATDLGCAAATPYCVAGVGGNACVACVGSGDCGDSNVCTQDVCTAVGVCSNPPAMAGTSCTGGVCDGLGSALCEACVDSGSGTDVGCNATNRHCIGASGARQCVECESALHCDDSVDCTDDACTANACVNTSVAAGDAGECAGSLVCTGGPSDLCVTCANTDAGAGMDAGCTGGAPFCATLGAGGPTCEVCVNSGAGTDTGCGNAAPNCVVSTGGANQCVSCITGADCSDGNECTTDVCTTGVCTNPALTEFSLCSLGVCTAASACSPVAVSITTPADGSRTADNMPTLTGTATPGVTVGLLIDGNFVDAAPADASGNWSLALSSPLNDGLRGLVAEVIIGMLDASDTSNFTVDTVTTVTIDSPADGGTSMDSSPLLVGTGEVGASVAVTLDGTLIGTVVVAGDGRWMLTVPSAVANGSHMVDADATDDLGNMASTSSTFTIQADTSIDIDGPTDGAVINDNTPTITGTALPGASVTVTTDIGGTIATLGTAVADGSGVWTMDVSTALADATYIITATATDLAGNMATDSSTFTVDTMTFVVIASVDATTGVVSGTGEPGASVAVTIDGVIVGTVVVAGDGTWTFDGDALGVGQHTVTATATDPAGNTATDTTSLVVSTPDGGVTPDGGSATGTGGLSGGAMCATHGPSDASWPAGAGILLIGLALVTRRRRR